jgi:chitinase
LGSKILDPVKLAAAYQSVINQYKVTAVDFDIEGGIIADKASINSRNIALKILKQNNPKLRISYTLPVLPTGLTNDGYYVLTSAVQNGATIDVINLMTMDFGPGVAPNGATGMGGYSISAATAVYNQIQKAGLKSTIGICPMVKHLGNKIDWKK